MVTLDEVARVAEALPEVTRGERYGRPTWFVRRQAFAWERPLGKADVRRLGDARVPEGPILAVATEDLAEKAAVLAARHRGFFDIEHFAGYPAVLVELERAAPGVVRDALVDAWLAKAPTALAEAFVADGGLRRR